MQGGQSQEAMREQFVDTFQIARESAIGGPGRGDREQSEHRQGIAASKLHSDADQGNGH